MKSDGDLRRLFRKNLPEVFWTSIESRLTQQGIPDLHGICKGKSFWIENKKARGNIVRFQPMQIGWLKRYARCGGACFVAVRAKNALWLLPGGSVEVIAVKGLTAMPKQTLLGSNGPKAWPWPRILELLQGVA
jgi:Holliday junction resolvase